MGGHLTVELHKLVRRLLDIPRSFWLIGSIDAVIVPGMGVLEESLSVRPWGLPYWLFLIALACRLRGRHFILLGIGADRAANPLTRWLYRATARLASHISYRDHPSAAAMTRRGVKGPPVVVPDLAFAHPAPTEDQREVGRIVVGVMPYYGPGKDPTRGEAVRGYVAKIAEALATLADAGTRIVLVGGDVADIDVARQIQAAILTSSRDLPEDAVIAPQPTTFAELTREMKQAEVVIASRYHNLICSLRLGRPTISVEYAVKGWTLMHALGLSDYCQHIDQLDAGHLVAQVRAAQRDADTLTAQIRAAESHYRGEVESLLRHVTTEELRLDTHKHPQLAVKDSVDECEL